MDNMINKHIPNRSVDIYTFAVANLFNMIMIVILYLRTTDVIHPLIFGYVWAGLIITRVL